MRLWGMIAGLIVILTCIGMVVIAIKKERKIRKCQKEKAHLSIRHLILCMGIICNIILGANSLILTVMTPNPSLPHDIYVVPLFMTPLGYILFYVYYSKVSRLIKS